MAERRVVQLFHTCLVNEIGPEVGLAAARLLERLGLEVEVPAAQTCCGQPAYNAGFPEEARAAARHTIAVLEAAEGPVVVPSGSCADMIVHQYEVLFHGDAAWTARAHALSRRTRELSQFLAGHPGGTALGARVGARVVYHPSCHLLRGLGERAAPKTLLQSVQGVEVVAARDEEECCGFGGLFSIKNPEISGSMLDRKLAAFEACGADRLVSCDLGCLLHLGGGLRRRGSPMRVQHLAELLDEGLP